MTSYIPSSLSEGMFYNPPAEQAVAPFQIEFPFESEDPQYLKELKEFAEHSIAEGESSTKSEEERRLEQLASLGPGPTMQPSSAAKRNLLNL